MTTKFSENDKKLKKAIRDKGLSESRINLYDIVFNEIFEITGYTPTKILEIAKTEQKPFQNNNGTIDSIELDERTISKIQDQYYDYLKNKEHKGKPLMNSTIRTKIRVYRAFLNTDSIELPRPIKITVPKERIRDKDIPTWKDVKNAINLAKSPRDSAIIAFAVTTGFRISDIVGFKLKDLVEACEIFFDETEERTIENLLNKNPDDIIPCWELAPQKTKNRENPNLTITFNTPETSNYLWFYLKDRINQSKKKDENYIVDLEEPLFMSQRKGHLNKLSVENHFRDLNKRLNNEKDKNGVYIKFRLQNLRKLFKTTCRRKLSQSDLKIDDTYKGDIINLFTGNATPNNPLAYTYEAVEEDSHESIIRKYYQALIPYLSIQPTEVKQINTKQYKDLEEKNIELERQLKIQSMDMERELSEQKEYYEKKIKHFESLNSSLISDMEILKKQMLHITNEKNIDKIQDYIMDNELVNKYDLANRINELYIEDISENPNVFVVHSYIDELIYRAYEELPENDKKDNLKLAY